MESSRVVDEQAGRFVFGAMNLRIVIALAIIWVLNWVITFFGIKKGIERANKIFIPLLLVLVAALVGWSLTLKGAGQGVTFYLKPDWSVLGNPSVWTQAFAQIFFTLSLGFGIMIAYASYLPRESDIPVYALLTSLGNCAFSIFAGFAVSMILFFRARDVSRLYFFDLSGAALGAMATIPLLGLVGGINAQLAAAILACAAAAAASTRTGAAQRATERFVVFHQGTGNAVANCTRLTSITTAFYKNLDVELVRHVRKL